MTLKQKLQTMKTSTMLLQAYDSEKTKNLTLRNFKIGINSLKSLTQYQIDNLAKFLDKQDEGYISIDEFETSLRGVIVPLSSTGSFSSTGKRNEKWK